MKDLKAAIKALEACKKKIAVERDKMREIVEEYSNIIDSCDDAERDFQAALDTLSQYL